MRVSHHSTTIREQPASRKSVRWAEDENGEPHPDNFNDATGGSLVPLQVVHYVDKLSLEVLRGDDWRATEAAFYEFHPREALFESEKAERWARFMDAIATQSDPDCAVIGLMWRALYGQALRLEEVAVPKPSIPEKPSVPCKTNTDMSTEDKLIISACLYDSVTVVSTPMSTPPPVVPDEFTEKSSV